MYKANQKHLQPLLISNVNDLPEEQRQRLESSWAGEFYREFFCRIQEGTFAVLYADVLPTKYADKRVIGTGNAEGGVWLE
jgi:hypothetical protein